MSKRLDLEELNLPEDVIFNSGNVELYGELKGDPNEIIVITQIGRFLRNAYVCHLSDGYESRKDRKSVV